MGKISSNRKGSCQVCDSKWDLGGQINLGKRPDGSWAICSQDDCFSKQVAGESVPDKKNSSNTSSTTQQQPQTSGSLDKFTSVGTTNKTFVKNAEEVKAFYDSVGKLAWDQITELYQVNGQTITPTQKIISWEGLLKVYATVWTGKVTN